ncbi:hypothetical protein [Chlamydiifrater phoenicopteri]|uniref:hypothetical protein n=1 Tax=Chlamydiifrater phoenicopteri TaxID=2681469 RepID=UPI001BCAF71A|nr:hypothetical protein [Chlamydiifrater phoenicopteri]
MLPSILPGFFFIFYAVIAFLGAYLAIRKGRNPLGWFLGTLFLGFFGIFLLLILPPKNSPEQENSKPDDNTDFFQSLDSSDPENVNDNLFLSPDVHSVLDKGQDEQTESPKKSCEEDQWFYLDLNKNTIGPLSYEDLCKEIQTIGSRPEDWKKIWVWKKGMKDWERAGNLNTTGESEN